MTHDDPGADPREAELLDTGEPVVELAKLADESPPDVSISGFTERVRGRVERRALGANLGSLIWHAPGAVLLELLAMVFGFRADTARDEGDSK